MTDDDVIQFAAEKLDIVPCDNWERFNSQTMMKIDESCGHRNCVPRCFYPPKITSWELLGRGLAAAYMQGWYFNVAIGKPCVITVNGDPIREYPIELIMDISGLPKGFWTAWYRLEHDET